MTDMPSLSVADRIWNRAALDHGGPNPGPGDHALAGLLLAHGLIMNGGVLHALEALSPREVAQACSGYRFYDLTAVASLVEGAQVELAALADSDIPDELENRLDEGYSRLVPSDAVLVEAFERHYESSPADYSRL